jgi:pimeloyl-ACP methyl ester carboxylesterase
MDVATLDSHRCLTTTESGSVSYVDVGRGRPAVFIHGIFTNAVLWRKVIGAVASDDRRCIAIELPGHGRTPPALEQADVSITGLARRVIELCNHLGLQRFDLVANDTGGAIAQVVAAESSDRIATLSLTNCDTERNTPPTLFRPIAFIARPKALGVIGPRIAARRGLARLLLLPGYRDISAVPDEVVDAYARPVLGTRTSAAAFGRLVAALSSDDLAAVRSRLASMEVPTLIVWGTADAFFPMKWARRLADLIPGTTALHPIAGARMHLVDERADEFIPLMLHHWASHQ